MNDSLSHSNLDFLRELEKYTFESKILVCQKYSSRIMTASMVDMTKAYQENIMPWELEIFSTYSIIYDRDDATEELNGESFAEIITKIRNYKHRGLIEAEQNGIYPGTFIMVASLQQKPVQGLIMQRLFRYHYFFTFRNSKIDMNKVFVDKIGIEFEGLEKLAFIVFICLSKEAQDRIPKERSREVLAKALSNPEKLKPITVTKEEYIKQLWSLNGENIEDQFYGLKPQYIFPIISNNNAIYIPSPYLIINAVTESMLNRITLNDEPLRKTFGKEVIESYLYDIVSQLSTVTWISPEIEYYIGKNRNLTSDVLSAEGDCVIFYDTKAIVPSLKIRKFDKYKIEKTIEIYANYIKKIYRQIKNYLDGHFQLDKKYEQENIYGIVVVLEDAVVERSKVYDKAISMISTESPEISDEINDYIRAHIKVLPLSEIEGMILQNTSLLPDLISQKNKNDRWNHYSYSTRSTANGLIPIYEEYVRELKSAVSKEI